MTYYEVRRHDDAHEPPETTVGTDNLVSALRQATWEANFLEREDEEFALNVLEADDELFEIYPVRGHGTVVVATTDEL